MRKRVHANGQAHKFGFLFRRGAHGKKAVLHFQGLAHGVVPANVFPGWDAYPGVGAGTAFGQAFEFESHESFGHRQETHAQLGRQLSTRNRLPHRQVAAQDALPNHQAG